MNDKVYIVGCSETIHYNATVDTVLMFDPQTNQCGQVGRLPYIVSSMATTTWNDNLVVLSGLDSNHNELNSAVMYNVTNGNHQMLPEMGNKRYGSTAATIGDNILVIGGRDAISERLDSVECFNLGTNAWTDFPATTDWNYCFDIRTCSEDCLFQVIFQMETTVNSILCKYSFCQSPQ